MSSYNIHHVQLHNKQRTKVKCLVIFSILMTSLIVKSITISQNIVGSSTTIQWPYKLPNEEMINNVFMSWRTEGNEPSAQFLGNVSKNSM